MIPPIFMMFGIFGSQASVVQTFTGGFFVDFERQQARKRRERRRREEAEREARQIKDEASREIAQFLHQQEQIDSDRFEIERLRELVSSALRHSELLSGRARVAAEVARLKNTTASLLAFERELRKQLDDEEQAALLLILND